MSRIFFDYSTMVEWKGAPTGIPRVVEKMARGMRSQLGQELHLIGINDSLKAFYSLNLIDSANENWKLNRENPFGQPVQFEKGDRLFAFGATWAYACYLPVVRSWVEKGLRYQPLFHDTIPWKFPYFFEQGLQFGDYFGAHLRESFSLADIAFANSQSTKRDMIELCNANPERAAQLHVLRLGDSVELTQIQPTAETSDRVQSLGPYILTVGTVERRKNHQVLLNAYRKLTEEGFGPVPSLVIVGRYGFGHGDIDFQVRNDRFLRDKVTIIPDATDELLAELYRKCLFTVYPAFYEGWGLPVAESLTFGKQCITSNTSSMLEIAPELTRFADPNSVTAWAMELRQVLRDRNCLDAEEVRIRSVYRKSFWSDACMKALDCGFTNTEKSASFHHI